MNYPVLCVIIGVTATTSAWATPITPPNVWDEADQNYTQVISDINSAFTVQVLANPSGYPYQSTLTLDNNSITFNPGLHLSNFSGINAEDFPSQSAELLLLITPLTGATLLSGVGTDSASWSDTGPTGQVAAYMPVGSVGGFGPGSGGGTFSQSLFSNITAPLTLDLKWFVTSQPGAPLFDGLDGETHGSAEVGPFNLKVHSVPEPSTWGLMAVGLVALALTRRRGPTMTLRT